MDARTLHEALGVGRDFSNWIKDRIEKYSFVEGRDYELIVAKFGDYSGGPGNPNFVSKDYLLTLTTAKEIAMVENNERGREIRQYLIKVEEAWNTPDMVIQRVLMTMRRGVDLIDTPGGKTRR